MRTREEIENYASVMTNGGKEDIHNQFILLGCIFELLLDIRDLLTPEIKIEDEKEVIVYRNDFEENRYPKVSITNGKEWISLKTWTSLTMIRQGSGLCFEFEGQFFYLYIQSVTVSKDDSGYDFIEYKGINLDKEELELRILQEE